MIFGLTLRFPLWSFFSAFARGGSEAGAGMRPGPAEEVLSSEENTKAPGRQCSKEEIEAAIRKGMVDQNVTLSEDEIAQIIDLMMKVKAMGIDYKVLAEQADDIYAKYKDDIQAGTFDINKVDLNDLGLTKIIGNAITSTAKNIGNSIVGFFSGLFDSWIII